MIEAEYTLKCDDAKVRVWKDSNSVGGFWKWSCSYCDGSGSERNSHPNEAEAKRWAKFAYMGLYIHDLSTKRTNQAKKRAVWIKTIPGK